MIINRLLTFILISSSLNALASEFKFNNKNLNSLGAIICQNTTVKESQHITAHKISIHKDKRSDHKKNMQYEIIGTCDIKYSKNTQKVVSLGDEFSLSFTTNNYQQIEGRLGIKKIFLNFRKKNLHSLVIIDPLMQTTKRIYLSKSKWATSDTIFNFNKSNLELKISRKTAAVESNSMLRFKDKSKTRYYNLWSFESFGCTNNVKKVTSEQCQKIVSGIN